MRILVVEDEPKMATLVRRGLERESFACDLAVDGNEALWATREVTYDAIVLDVMIPGPDGFEVCRRLRAAGNWTPVLLLTARDAGADDYLTKPFAMGELFARLRAITRREPAARPVALQVGDLVLDPARHEVHRGDAEIRLSPKEFALLEFLMRHSGEVLGRSQILDHVWDFAYDGTSNVVDVYMRYLRAKVDRPFGVESIETVRGVGYRLRGTTSDEKVSAS